MEALPVPGTLYLGDQAHGRHIKCSSQRLVAAEDIVERPGALGRNVGSCVGLLAGEGAGGEARGGLVVDIEVCLEALADLGG